MLPAMHIVSISISLARGRLKIGDEMSVVAYQY